nr:hypothetical protein [uncultured bacterium]
MRMTNVQRWWDRTPSHRSLEKAARDLRHRLHSCLPKGLGSMIWPNIEATLRSPSHC